MLTTQVNLTKLQDYLLNNEAKRQLVATAFQEKTGVMPKNINEIILFCKYTINSKLIEILCKDVEKEFINMSPIAVIRKAIENRIIMYSDKTGFVSSDVIFTKTVRTENELISYTNKLRTVMHNKYVGVFAKTFSIKIM